MNPDPDIILLLQIWNDPDATGESRTRLLKRLRTDDAFRAEAAEQLAMIAALRAAQAPEPRWLELHDLLGAGESGSFSEIGSFENSVMERIGPARAVKTRTPWMWLAIAAMLTLALGSQWWFGAYGGRPDSVRPLSSAAVPEPIPVASIIELVIPAGTPAPSGLANGKILAAGPLELKNGSLSIQTVRGVTVSMNAPFRARLVSETEIEVIEGNLLARIPQGCEDFKMHGPSFQIQDLGAEAVVVRGTGGTRAVRVFEGRTDLKIADPSLAQSNQPSLAEKSGDPKQIPVPEASDDVAAGEAPQHSLLAIGNYPQQVHSLKPSCYWRLQQMSSGKTPSDLPEVPPMEVIGEATLANQTPDNSVGTLSGADHVAAFRPHFRPDMLSGDFTITFWAQAHSLRNGVLLSANRNDDREKDYSFLLLAVADRRAGSDAGLRLQMGLDRFQSSEKSRPLSGNQSMKPGQWHHIAAVRDRDILRLYLDGREIGHGRATEGKPAFTRMLVGRLNVDPSKSAAEARAFNGSIDELAIFEQALKPHDISNLAKGAHEQAPDSAGSSRKEDAR